MLKVAVAPALRRMPLLGALLLTAAAVSACNNDKKSSTENSETAVARTECPAGQQQVDGACVANEPE